jgi:SAM-dependent methyltransferase
VSHRVAVLSRLAPYIERARTFSGWDHSSLDIRVPPLPWDYEALARERATRASTVLDVGTGGGERYSTIAAGLPARFVATEEWGINAVVAHRRLAPLRIPLVHCLSAGLPFPDSTFDLVLSRHEAIEPVECDRILRPGGVFFTQQCAPDNWKEFRRFFPRATVFPPHDRLYPDAFRAAGYEVAFQRHEYPATFGSLGDVVFMLMTAPWTIPDFDPQKDLDALMALEAELGTADGIVLTEGRYLLEARKPERHAPSGSTQELI